MFHFALLRQRIKVIQSIQKTTSAMRLIAMSIQSRLKKKDIALKNYTALLERVYKAYVAQSSNIDQQVAAPPDERLQKQLVILVGSQKALCGSFNERLWEFVMHEEKQLLSLPCITIGTYATQLAYQHGVPLRSSYNEFSSSTLIKVAQQITKLVTGERIDTLYVLGSHSRTFFIQQPRKTVIPMRWADSSPNSSVTEHTLKQYLATLHVQNTLIRLLQDSLLAEQAARFLSMDTATRNADGLLESTRLAYNKARQAHVTRELIELTSGYDTD